MADDVSEGISLAGVLIKEILQNQRDMSVKMDGMVSRPEWQAIISRLDTTATKDSVDLRLKQMDIKLDDLARDFRGFCAADADNRKDRVHLPTWFQTATVAGGCSIFATTIGI